MSDTAAHPIAIRTNAYLPKALAEQFHVCAADELTSTNTVLKEYTASAAAEGKQISPTVLIARTQSGGRGRLGRSFHSPGGTGLYMSILLIPTLPPRESLCLTTAAAAACADAADAVRRSTDPTLSGEIGIKWVNDLYLNDKKICGILAEAALTPQGDTLAWAVIGIGINLLPPKGGFPDEISHSAGALLHTDTDLDTDDILAQLSADILRRLMEYLDPTKKETVLSVYRRRSVLDGRAVLVRPAGSLGGEEIPAVVCGIDDEFGLIVRYADGRESVLSSGEVVLCGEGIASAIQTSRASVHLT